MGMDPYQSVWITGASGRMGRAVEHYLTRQKRFTVLTTDREIDVSDLDAVSDFCARNRPSIVINCAGVAKDTDAAIDAIEAYRVNTLGARNLAIASEAIGAIIVHLSTDDLFFSEEERCVNEFDEPNPSTVFGKSKLAGERFVRELNPRHIIIRSSWVYTALPEDKLMQCIEKAKHGETVRVAANQIASPTSAATLAAFTGRALLKEEFGVFHASTEGVVSRCDFVRRAFEIAGLDPALAQPDEDNAEAYRIELDNLMLKITGLFSFPAWEEDLARFMKLYDLAR